jgi:predicted DNA-binding transcriptional regulator AlpA
VDRTLSDDEIMDTLGVEDLTGVKTGTLRYWRSTNQGPPWFRLGDRRIAYLRSDVLRWLQEQIDGTYTDPSGSTEHGKPMVLSRPTAPTPEPATRSRSRRSKPTAGAAKK